LFVDLRCHDTFGYQFSSSALAARAICFAPLLLDAVAVVGQRRGQSFLDFFGEVMTGVRPKSDFLQIDLVFDLALEVVKQFVIQYIFRRKPLLRDDIGVDIVNKQAGLKEKN
jgi:hypothetical protein